MEAGLQAPRLTCGYCEEKPLNSPSALAPAADDGVRWQGSALNSTPVNFSSSIAWASRWKMRKVRS
jgi:hypothetical protein